MTDLSAYITANTVTDIFYIVRKHIKDKEALWERRCPSGKMRKTT